VDKEVQAAVAEQVPDMTMAAHDFRVYNLNVPAELNKGLDRVVNHVVGRYKRRSAQLSDLHKEAEQIVAGSLKLRYESDHKLKEHVSRLKAIFRRQGRGHEEYIKEAMTVLSEISYRTVGLRPYPVQIMGAMSLYRGFLLEMATGEGKSLTACFPAILAGWTKRPCHIITSNDYLAGRDADEMGPFYSFCDVSVGSVNNVMETVERRVNYAKDVVYTTSKEILADFLRDRLKMGSCNQSTRRIIQLMQKKGIQDNEGTVMRGLDTAIIDEADSVLIDEAVTPLIISHPRANAHLEEACLKAGDIAKNLNASRDYTIDMKHREIMLTKAGHEKIKSLAESLPGIWTGNIRRDELIIQSLTAKEFYHRDKQYVVKEGKIVIVDEFTGRLMPDRTWRQGLHQAVEALEGLEISDPSETLSRLSFQRFFRFFRKLSGMTGTAMESASEFWHIYSLPVIKIPTNKPCIRKQESDKVFSSNDNKLEAVIDEIIEVNDTGRPVLVGTRNIKVSNKLASMLTERGLPFNLLNALNHKEEAAIVAAAGKKGAITIATNMAGRGTDIKLEEGVAELGGLHVIATEKHESGRIDRQLIGRCARQGDPGSARAFISIEDELMQRFLPSIGRQWISSSIDKQIPYMKSIAESLNALVQRSASGIAFRQRRRVIEMDTWLAEAPSFTGPSVES